MIRRVTIPIDRGDAAMTFRDFARDFCKDYGQWGYSVNTVDLYDRHCMAFLAFIKSRRQPDSLSSFNDQNVYEFATYLLRPVSEAGCGIQPNTVIGVLSALSALAKYGMQRREGGKRLLTENPTKSFRWPQAQMKETKYLLPADLRRIVDADAPVYMALPRDVFIETGIRSSEAANLNVGSLKEVGGRWYLAIVVKRRGDRRKVYPVDIPLSRALGESLRNAVLLRESRLQEPEAPLLLTSEGKRWTRRAISNMMAALGAAAGVTRLRVSAHTLRHTRETIDRLAGMDRVVQARLRGRSSIRSLERYDHVLPEELADARELGNDGTRAYLGEPVRPQTESDPPGAKEAVPRPRDNPAPRQDNP